MANTRNNLNQEILQSYATCSWQDKLHIWVRLKTCPFSVIEEKVPKQGTILDYGCGHGVFSHLLSLKSWERRIIGIDISPSKIDAAIKSIEFKDYKERVSFFAGNDIGNSNTGALDCITIIDVLYLVPETAQKSIFIKCYQKLNKNGALIIKTMKKKPVWKYGLSLTQEIISVKILRITQGNKLYFMPENKLKRFLEEAGFKVSVLEMDNGYYYPHVLYVCIK